MLSVGLGLGIVEGGQVEVLGVGVAPLRFAGDHLPPHAHVLRGMYPRCVVECAGVVEVEHHCRREDVGGLVAEHDHTPGCGARQCQRGLCLGDARGEMAHKRHGGVVEVEVHGRIIHQRGLMEIDVHAVVVLEHQRCLHPPWVRSLSGRHCLCASPR